MTKEEAVKTFVEREFSNVPIDWVQAVAEKNNEEVYAWPMWGTMFLCDEFVGKHLKTRRMLQGLDELEDEVSQDDNSNYSDKERQVLRKAIKKEDWSVLESYIDEEMAGADCILDKDGRTTAAYLFHVDGRYLIGINGAGWNFYDGVWNKIYEALGLEWHEEERELVTV